MAAENNVRDVKRKEIMKEVEDSLYTDVQKILDRIEDLTNRIEDFLYILNEHVNLMTKKDVFNPKIYYDFAKETAVTVVALAKILRDKVDELWECLKKQSS